MARSVSSTDFNTWAGNPTPEEYEANLKTLKKRLILWTLLSLIPIANFVFSGFAVFTLNNYQAYKSRSLVKSYFWVSLVRFCLMMWGFIIFPLLIVRILAGGNKLSGSLASKVLGI